MDRILLLVLVLAGCISCLAADPEVSAPPQPDVAFFTKLRMDYSQRKGFDPAWKLEDERKAVVDAYRAKDYQKAFVLSERWLAKCPVDGDVHTLRSAAARELGDVKSYVYHLYFAYGLMQSVTQSGDGLTPKTAYKVISISEEYSILRDFGAELISQSLVEGPCDRMDCKLPGDKKASIYFDVSIPIQFEGSRYNLKPK